MATVCSNGGAYLQGVKGSDWIRLDAIHHSLAHGIMKNVRSMTARWGASLANSPSAPTRDEYAEVMARAEKAFLIEEEHGEGCLLDLDSSLIKSMVASPEQYFSQDEIGAARRYRDRVTA